LSTSGCSSKRKKAEAAQRERVLRIGKAVRRAGFGLLVAAVVAWAVAPFLWQLVTSLKPTAEISSLPPLLPTRVDLGHYAAVFERHRFGRFIWNSAVVATMTTVTCLVIGSFASFAVAKLRFRAKALLLGLVLSVSMFPPIATVSPLYLMMRTVGLRDTHAALVITYTTFALPLTIWILTGFFRKIPDDLLEAAKIDGCTPFQAFWRVVVPLAAPGVFTTAILVFIFAWNEFLFALTFTATPRAKTIPVGIAEFPGVHEMPWGDIAAASVIVTVPLVILVLVFQRRIVAGLTAGAVKG
jgi:multiple sugar transport system permease protein